MSTLNYLCLLISIKFTQARCIDDVDNKFKNESNGVNATSPEFLEFLVNIISDEKLLIKDERKLIKQANIEAKFQKSNYSKYYVNPETIKLNHIIKNIIEIKL